MKQQRQEISCQESWKQSAQTISFDWTDLLSETMSKGNSEIFSDASSESKQFQISTYRKLWNGFYFNPMKA